MTAVNMINANNFKSTKESRKILIAKLSKTEAKMFDEFVISVNNTIKGI